MSKKLDLSACSSTNIMYMKSGTFDFLQLAYQEGIAAACKALIGPSYNTSKVYIIQGIKLIAAGPSTGFGAGAVFYNEEVFLHDSSSTLNASTTVLNLELTQYTTFADPTDFSDGTPRNVHNIRKVKFANGTSGTGSLTGNANSDLDNVIRINFQDIYQVATLNGSTYKMTNDRYITSQGAGYTSGVQTINIDLTDARVGTTLYGFDYGNIGDSISINQSAGTLFYTTSNVKTTNNPYYVKVKVVSIGDGVLTSPVLEISVYGL